MTGPPLHRPVRPAELALLALLFGAAVLLAIGTALSWPVALAVAGAGVAGTAALRTRPDPAGGPVALVPVLVAVGVLAAEAPSTPATDLFGGLAGVAVLAWLAGDPRRSAGGLARSIPSLLIVALTLGIAWTAAFLLPSGTSLLGVGGALLVLATILLAVLLGRPDLIDREPPATA